MGDYKPTYTITEETLSLTAEICEVIGSTRSLRDDLWSSKLRRENRIRTIHSSLAIEQNTLSLEQVTDIINGKRVLGKPNEIREVQNAYAAYSILTELSPFAVVDLQRAHSLMMEGLVKENGQFRSGGVGIFSGERLIHMAPPAEMVFPLITQLLAWYKASGLHPLVKSCIFHYEFEFIHPFQDGNGRMGRMWHSLLLGQWRKFFLWFPIEELLRSQTIGYYEALRKSDQAADCTDFIEFMLKVLLKCVKDHVKSDQVTDQVTDQDKVKNKVAKDVDAAHRLAQALGRRTLSAAQLMERLGLTHRPTFRKNYLNPALEAGLIEYTLPEKPNSKNQKYRKAKK